MKFQSGERNSDMSYVEESMKQGKKLYEILPLNFESYNQLLEKIKLEPQIKPVPSPYEGLNVMTDGFDPGRLYVLGAPPKMGKTTLVTSIMYKLAKKGTKTLLFSYEVSWQEIVRTIEGMEIFDQITPGTVNVPFFMPTALHRGGDKLQLQWLLEAIAKAKEEGVELIAIDHLHFLIPYQMTDNFSIVVGNVVREIKRLAVMFQIPIILIVPMKNLQTAREPTFWDVRDSSMILHEADDVMIMYRLSVQKALKLAKLQTPKSDKMSDDEDIDDRELAPVSVLSLELNRKRGSSGKVYLWHNGAYFEEVPKNMVAPKVDIWRKYAQKNQ